MTENEPCYVAMKPCGCIVGAVVDNPEHKKDVAKDVAKWVRAGLTIERKDSEYVRSLEHFGCQCENKP